MLGITATNVPQPTHAYTGGEEKFRVWIITDPHFNVTNNEYQNTPTGYTVAKKAIQDSEQDWGYTWDISFVLGDIANDATESQYQEARNCFNEVPALHNREDFYFIAGNHDCYQGSAGRTYFDEYIDPAGDNTALSGVNPSNRPYPVENITSDETLYTVRVGNTLFVFMSPCCTEIDYYYNFTWWRSIVENASDDLNIICLSHHWVTGSGLRSNRVHGMENSAQFASWMQNHVGRISAWFSGHDHWTYDETGEVYVATNWGTTFINAASFNDAIGQTAAKSVLLTFEEGNATVRVGDYFHGYSSFDYHGNVAQWDPNDPCRGNFTFQLSHPFYLSNNNLQVLDSASFTMEAEVSQNETPSPSLTLLDSKTFTMSAVVLNESVNNGSGFTIPLSSIPYYYVLAGMLVFFPFLAIVYKKWR